MKQVFEANIVTTLSLSPLATRSAPLDRGQRDRSFEPGSRRVRPNFGRSDFAPCKGTKADLNTASPGPRGRVGEYSPFCYRVCLEGIIIRGGKASNDDGAEMTESQGMRPTSEDKRRHAEREEEGGGNDEEKQRGRSKAFWADGVGHAVRGNRIHYFSGGSPAVPNHGNSRVTAPKAALCYR